MSNTIRAILILVACMLFISVAAQIRSALTGNYKTETALRYTAENTAEFKGIYVRDESVISDNIQGVVSYMYPDGSKIARDSVAAIVYDSAEAVKINEEIEKVEKQIEILQKSQNPGTTEVAQPEFITKQLDLSYNKIASYIESGDYDLIQKEKENFQVLSNILQIVIGKEENYNDLINSYQSKLDSLKSTQRPPSYLVKSDKSGYFVSYADGYEDKLNKGNIYSLTVDQIKGITSDKNANKRKNNIGKIIYGYDWKMIGIVDNSKNEISEGTTVSLKLPTIKLPVKVKIEKIKETENPEESIVILSSNKLTEDLVQHRVENVRMIISEHSGIKVPRNAIRFNALDEKGVYVQLGEQVLFKKIDVIYDAEDYVISRETDMKGTLQLYDDIIVEGIPRQDEIITEETDPVVTETSEDISIVVGETTKQVTETTVTKKAVDGSAENNE